MKRWLSNFCLTLVLLVGLSLILYPTVSDWWNSMHQTRVMTSYSEAVQSVDPAVYDEAWESARAYNQTLPGNELRFLMTQEQRDVYNRELNPAGDGIMGIIEIPTLGIELPIYHSTTEAVLQVAIGHIEGTSLPTGGEGTHCALSGHRGLPRARLFTDLDKLIEGDVFLLHILNETLTYEVDRILIVGPRDLDALEIEEDKDYCTLVTCTPYGINTHRMLVRGSRIETVKEKAPVRISADAGRIDPVIVAPLMALPMLLIMLILVMFSDPKKNTGGEQNEEDSLDDLPADDDRAGSSGSGGTE